MTSICSASSAPSRRISRPGSRSAPRGALSGCTSPLGRAESTPEHGAGWAAANSWSTATGKTASSRATCWCRSFLARGEGRYAAAHDTAREAAEIAERFDDADLHALALHAQGLSLTRLGRVEDGLALVDEAMLAVTSGELSPIVTGLVYCSVIEGCHEVYAMRRAQEWTTALTQWCAQQPEMVAFTGRCLVHRAEIMQLHGAWQEALEEARRAAKRRGLGEAGVAQAFYRQGDVHRLQGELAAAENTYRNASRHGWEPQPGLALLRLAQGNVEAASAAIRRTVVETSNPLRRAALLAASVEILLAAGDAAGARGASRELGKAAADYEIGMLDALAEHARGAVDLADGKAEPALVSLRRAWQLWSELEAPYEAARARELVGRACRMLGDEDAATLELQAAREVFAELGAMPNLARLAEHASPAETHGLTAASSKSSAWSPPACPTRPLPASSSSATGRWTAT